MKQNFKRTLAAVMAAALTVSLMGTGTESDAAKKKIKLSKRFITVTKGKRKKVTIKNVKAKQVKKLVVKSSKKKIATVKKSGKTAINVTGKRAGNAKITVKVTVKGKKKATKLTLKVKVKNTAKKLVTPGGQSPSVPGTSQAPASEAPASQAPASEAPASQAPASEAPASQAPASEAPASQAPASEAPASQAPASEAPASEAPASEAPASEAPASEAPASEAPASEAPASQAPASEAPASQAPATQEPAKVETPTIEITIDKDTIRVTETANVEIEVSAGEIQQVTWAVENSQAAKIQKDSLDAKRAAVIGVAAGETKLIAEVIISVEGKQFALKKEIRLTILEKDALIVKATFETAPAEIAINETGAIIVAVDTGVIENVIWAIEGDAAVLEAETRSVEGVLAAKKVGEVTVSATVTVISGGKKATDTVEKTVKVTPIAYGIGKTITVKADAGESDWFAVALDEAIRVKKTDIVEAVISMKIGAADTQTTNMQVVLSPVTDTGNPWAVQQNAILRNTGTVAGKAVFTRDDAKFTSNYIEVKTVAVHKNAAVSGDAAVTIEKLLLTPTDEVAVSLKAPAGVEIGTPGTIIAEVDNGYVLEWKSATDQIATVRADESDQTKAIVTGVKAGVAEIRLIIKTKEGKVAKEESVTFNVSEAYKNKEMKLDLGTAQFEAGIPQTVKEGETVTGYDVTEQVGAIAFPLPHELAAGDKIQVIVKGEFKNSSTGFRVYVGTGGSNGQVTDNQKWVRGSEGAFTSDPIELITTGKCTHVCVRQPNQVIIKEVIVKYI